jgi:hypothetical protein
MLVPMRTAALGLLLAVPAVAARSAPDFLSSVVEVACGTSPPLVASTRSSGKEEGPTVNSFNPVADQSRCQSDVLQRFGDDKKTHVGTVKRGQLDCSALGLTPEMDILQFNFHVRVVNSFAAIDCVAKKLYLHALPRT